MTYLTLCTEKFLQQAAVTNMIDLCNYNKIIYKLRLMVANKLYNQEVQPP